MKPILLVEDTEDDVFLLERAFKKANVQVPFDVACDGQAALDMLGAGTADRLTGSRPRLVLLDLKLPQMGGLDVLKWIRKQPQLVTLPVIVLTSSREEKDIQAAYSLGANSYKVKPSDADELSLFAAALKSYWLTHDEAALYREFGR